jgi:hypothetical protein
MHILTAELNVNELRVNEEKENLNMKLHITFVNSKSPKLSTEMLWL